MGRPLRDSRQVIDGIIYRYRVGMAWRDLPADFGPWQTVWKRHNRYSYDGTWDAILAAVVALADSRGLVDWTVAVDSTIARAHQHATNTTRDTGGLAELQESAHRAA
jgi:putative transposase